MFPSRPIAFAIALALVPYSPIAARGGDAEELARYDASIKPAARRHWAFQPVKAVAPPAVKDSSRVRNPVDAFVLAGLEARGWTPSPAAEPRALLRRLYLDLTGLPPTPREQDAFLKDPSPQALDRVADDLLARPEYGERWARHWLDVARYADSNGYERDATKPSAWRYRDYVIDAFNKDKPFTRFVLEQLAGDELPDASAESVVATGFLRLGPWDDEPADPAADRFDQLDDMVSATSQAFLGLTPVAPVATTTSLSRCRCTTITGWSPSSILSTALEPAGPNATFPTSRRPSEVLTPPASNGSSRFERSRRPNRLPPEIRSGGSARRP
jgi:hypothetical protein